jgi:hypothetical protein
MLVWTSNFSKCVYSAYHLFKASVRFPTNDPTYIPHLADLRKVSNHLNILEGIFEAAPQAILQIYVNYLNYENLKTDIVARKLLIKLVHIDSSTVKL